MNRRLLLLLCCLLALPSLVACQRASEELAKLATEEEQVDRLCELNVIQQVANVAHTSIVQNAWHRGQSLSIHGCIYGIKDGRWKSLNTTISGFEQLPPQYRLRPVETK